jgi:hypothetical protein
VSEPVFQPVHPPKITQKELAKNHRKMKADMAAYNKSLLIPHLDPQIEKAIALAMQDGKWHHTGYYWAKCFNVIRPELAHRKAVALHKRVESDCEDKDGRLIDMGKEAIIRDNLLELHRLKRIEKRSGYTFYITKWRVKDQDWLTKCLSNEPH